jgi:hypothetical protein
MFGLSVSGVETIYTRQVSRRHMNDAHTAQHGCIKRRQLHQLLWCGPASASVKHDLDNQNNSTVLRILWYFPITGSKLPLR